MQDGPDPNSGAAHAGADAAGEGRSRHDEPNGDPTDVFFAMDRRLRYVRWSRAAEELTGIGASEAVGRSFYDLFPTAAGSLAEQVYLEVLRTGQDRTFRTEWGRTSYEVTVRPGHVGLLVSARDVTAYQHRE